MSKRFDGKIVLVTGGGSGLGRVSAIQVAKEGGKLSLVDVNIDSLNETKKLILEVTPEAQVLLITADVSNKEAVQSYVNKTIEEYGRVDGFFNNAGIEGKQNLTEDYG